MKRFQAVILCALIMLMVPIGANAAAYMKYDGIKGESAAQAGELAPGRAADGSATGALPQPSANKEKVDEKKSCIKASQGDEAGTAGGVVSNNTSGGVKCAPAIKVTVPPPRP
jgi:hypothetical protein